MTGQRISEAPFVNCIISAITAVVVALRYIFFFHGRVGSAIPLLRDISAANVIKQRAL